MSMRSLGIRASVGFLAMWIGCAPTDVSAPPTSSSWQLSDSATTVESDAGMVVSGHPLASQVGALVLERGGNAIDAAVAVGFALAVVLPEAGNIGGGGFLVYRSAEGAVRALDYRERAPTAASRDMYLDEQGNPTDRSVIGHLAAGVPGAVAGLAEMHGALGSISWNELLEPAIDLAQSHPIDRARSEHLASAASRLSRFPASAAQFLPGGKAPAVGDDFEQPDLKSTLESIRDRGGDGFYRGEVAARIVEEMERGGGIISSQDLEDYRAIWREPVMAEYRAHTVYSMPPPSSGGLTLGLILNILEGFSPLPEFGSGELLHLETEAMRRAFIDRNRHLGDPDYVDLPAERLQSQVYADSLRAAIDLERATPTPPFTLDSQEGTNTTHYSVVDRDGNAASITTTLNSGYGSAVTVAGAGFLLNNEMDDFAAAPGRPNQYGLVEGERNAIEPGKRMLSSMTPSIVLDPAGELLLVVGSPGGPTIITTVFQVISNVIDHGMTLARAVESPRVHHQALPDVLFLEHQGLPPGVVIELEAKGHVLRERSGLSGDVSAIMRHGQVWLGVADPRRGGGAAAPSTPPE